MILFLTLLYVGVLLLLVHFKLVPWNTFWKIAMDDGAAVATIPAGVTGEAAIYTQSAVVTHIIRKIMIRMTSYLNYVLPF